MTVPVDGKKIYKIVFTGGPSGGKSSALPHIEQGLIEYGCIPLVCPEMARDLIRRGMDIKSAVAAGDWETVFFYEKLMAEKQIFEENLMERLAQSMPSGDKPIVILLDRGLRDIVSYLPPGQEVRLCRELGIQPGSMYPYDRIIHLVTAADGAESHYKTDDERDESLEQARERDRATLHAWNGPVHVDVIDNSTDFEGKLNRVLRSVCHAIGIPEPIENERWFAVHECPALSEFPVPYVELEIEQIYLLPREDGVSRRIRAQKFGNITRYSLTDKKAIPGKIRQRMERTEAISAKSYRELRAFADPRRVPIQKKRVCFFWDKKYWELDQFQNPHPGKMKLEVELTSDSEEVTKPDWIKGPEVTGESRFSNRKLAKQGATWPTT